MRTAFTERQRFTQWWIWALLGGIALIPIYGLFRQMIVGESFGDQPMSTVGLFIFLIVILGALYCFWRIELRTEIDDESIRMRFSPFADREIRWEDVTQAEVLDYGFVGGWGLRMSLKYGKVYNTSGKMGLAIVLRDGTKLCIGTQRPAELQKFIDQVSNL